MGKSVNRERRALSARRGFWQSVAGAGKAATVKRMFIPLIASLAFPATLSAAPGGAIATLPTGTFHCELPGDAMGPVGRRMEKEDFTVITASAYRVGDKIGSYLLTGDTVRMTSGPFQGRRYHRIRTNFLRLIGPDGQDGQLRCVRPRGISR